MKKKALLFFALVGLLSACQINAGSISFEPYSYNLEPKNTFKNEQGDIYYRNDKVIPLDIEEIEGVNIKSGLHHYYDLNDVSSSYENNSYSALSNDVNNPNGVKVQKLLVAPVYFTDSDASLLDSKRERLENAFFGVKENTTYQSVASFYHQSSYGHLKIEGEVLPWMSINQSSEEAYKEGNKNPENYSDKIAKAIVDNLSEDKFNEYSTNRSGVLDALYIIYDHPYQNDKKNNEDSLFWAYTYHCKSTLKVSNYSWSSYDFVGNKRQVDATTYIHETGHLFGLLDYYNKGNLSYYQPLGFMDTMDYNLGDHSPFSKYLLNWTSPYILNMGNKEQGDISIRPFSESGDFILVPKSDYNGSPYDRYLLISFFSPTGLNDLSSFPSYEYYDRDGNARIFTYPNKYGVLVYEVNAKLAYYSASVIRSYTPKCPVDENPGSGDYYIYFNNKNELNKDSDKPLYHLLESSGHNTFKEGRSASNDTLFKYNSTFGVDTFTDLANEFGITFKVSKLTTNEAIITFNKIK